MTRLLALLLLSSCYGNYDEPLVIYEPAREASCAVPEDVDAGTEPVVEVPQDSVGEERGE